MTLQDFQDLIMNYGYLAILIGTFLEGETILIVAGFVAERGYLNIWLVMAAAFIGSMCGDQLAFWIGRAKGQSFIAKRPKLKKRVAKALHLFERHQNIILLGFRFVYGFRNVTPFAVGMSNVRATKFSFLNMIGAFIWAMAFGWGGYAFGVALEAILEKVKRYEMYIFGGMIGVFLLIWLYRFLRKKEEPDEETAAPSSDATSNVSTPPAPEQPRKDA
jgi:membrane protein DedA with SNARE-associated domain